MTALTLTAGAHAFGDGSHPTTRGVMEALAQIDPALFSPSNAIDIGAGSGILSLAVAQRFGCPVLAVDIEKSAVAALAENARVNGVDGITPLLADGFNHPDIAATAPYELMVMNILAEPLMRLAADAQAHLATGGVLILSGILVWQESAIREAYQALGLELTGRIQIGDWVTLLWQKP